MPDQEGEIKNWPEEPVEAPEEWQEMDDDSFDRAVNGIIDNVDTAVDDALNNTPIDKDQRFVDNPDRNNINGQIVSLAGLVKKDISNEAGMAPKEMPLSGDERATLATTGAAKIELSNAASASHYRRQIDRAKARMPMLASAREKQNLQRQIDKWQEELKKLQPKK
jgi:hypothetical protein